MAFRMKSLSRTVRHCWLRTGGFVARQVHVSCSSAVQRKAVVWGRANEGQLGNYKELYPSQPDRLLKNGPPDDPPRLLGPRILSEVGNPAQVRCGSSATAIVDADGSMYIMGKGQSSQLGLGPGVTMATQPRRLDLNARLASPIGRISREEAVRHRSDYGIHAAAGSLIDADEGEPLPSEKGGSAPSRYRSRKGWGTDLHPPPLEDDSDSDLESEFRSRTVSESDHDAHENSSSAQQPSSQPQADIPQAPPDVVDASIHDGHTLVLLRDGTIRVMGRGTEGQLMQGGGIGPAGSYHGGAQGDLMWPSPVPFFEERGLRVTRIATTAHFSLVVTEGSVDWGIAGMGSGLMAAGMAAGSSSGSTGATAGSVVEQVDALERKERQRRKEAKRDGDASGESSNGFKASGTGSVLRPQASTDDTEQTQGAKQDRDETETVVWACGSSFEGALGLGAVSATMEPVPLAALRGKSIVDVAAGHKFSLCLTADGQVFRSGSIGSSLKGGSLSMVPLPTDKTSSGVLTPSQVDVARHGAAVPAAGGPLSLAHGAIRVATEEESEKSTTPVPLEIEGGAEAIAWIENRVKELLAAESQEGGALDGPEGTPTTDGDQTAGQNQQPRDPQAGGVAGRIRSAMAYAATLLGSSDETKLGKAPTDSSSQQAETKEPGLPETTRIAEITAGASHAILTDGLLVYAVGSFHVGALGNGAMRGSWAIARPVDGLLEVAAQAITRELLKDFHGHDMAGSASGTSAVPSVRLERQMTGKGWQCIGKLADGSEAVASFPDGLVTCIDAAYTLSSAVVDHRVFVWGYHAKRLAGVSGQDGADGRGTSHLHSAVPIPVVHFEGPEARRELKVREIALGVNHAAAIVDILES